jgi:hypothetical protein
MRQMKSALAKALEVNQDPKIYGTFAEIGAGQEVARMFFQAGQASQTIAKTISAYDMIYSDEIYGKEASGRYVCESRLKKMLDKEYNLLTKRLDKTRGDRTTFFAFADTVATGDQKKRFSHGWLGVRFQLKPHGPSNDIILHVRMLDKYRLQQQEALAMLGVNLVSAAFYETKHPKDLISRLVENIREGQVSIDMIKFEGPDLEHINNHLMNLELVRRGLSEAILFGPDQKILNIADEVYNKSIILQRGTFRPVTNTNLDILTKGNYQFEQDFPDEAKNAMVLFELTMHNLQKDGHLNEQDFLDRVNSLCCLGGHVLVSNFFFYYKLKRFLRQYTQKPFILIVGALHLGGLFKDEHYKDLEGGMMEGVGKLLDANTRLYVYPHKDDKTCTTVKTFLPLTNGLIFKHFVEAGLIVDISGCDQIEEYIHSDQIRDWIEDKNPKWEKHVPKKIRDMIKKDKLFNLF